MKKCGDGCLPCCDFCTLLLRMPGDDWNGESLCAITQKFVDWGDYCDDFICFNAGLEGVICGENDE